MSWRGYITVEPLLFISFKISLENYRQAVVVCSSLEGEEFTFHADLVKVRALSKKQRVIVLSKRIWNTDWRFILELWPVDEKAFLEITDIARANISSLKEQVSFLSVQDLLDGLPKQGERRAVGELGPGHHVVHPDYGPGFVVGKVDRLGHPFVEFQFMKQHFKDGRIFIPAARQLPAYWRDLSLLES